MESGLPLVVGILPKEVIDLYKVMGSAMMATWLLWHPTMGAIYIDMQSCALRIVGLGLDPMADDCLALALQELSDLDD